MDKLFIIMESSQAELPYLNIISACNSQCRTETKFRMAHESKRRATKAQQPF